MMSNKRKFAVSAESESFMTRVQQRRQGRFDRKKGEGTKRERDYNGREAIIISQDIIVSRILTRLPVKTLLRFQSVCKYWREVIKDPWFKLLHLEQSKKNPVLLIEPLNSGEQTDISLYKYDNVDENINKSMKTAQLMFKKECWEALHVLDPPLHANGLILLEMPYTLAVCNPSTREFIRLPKGHYNAQSCDIDFEFTSLALGLPFKAPRGRAALCYVSSSNSYKVVQYFYRYFAHGGVYYDVGLEILTLGRKKECLRWEVVSEDPPYPIDCYTRPKAVGESVYFKINNRLCMTFPKAVLSYNLKDGKYRVVDFPPHYMTDFEGMNISDLEGDACVTCIRDRSVIDIWILSSTDFTLYHKFSIDLLPLHVRFCQPIAIRNGKLLLHLNDGIQRLDYYDPETGCFENVALLANDMTYYEKENCRLRIFNQDSDFLVTSFVESLVSVEGSASN